MNYPEKNFWALRADPPMLIIQGIIYAYQYPTLQMGEGREGKLRKGKMSQHSNTSMYGCRCVTGLYLNHAQLRGQGVLTPKPEQVLTLLKDTAIFFVYTYFN